MSITHPHWKWDNVHIYFGWESGVQSSHRSNTGVTSQLKKNESVSNDESEILSVLKLKADDSVSGNCGSWVKRPKREKRK